uniref:Uncharacterized protein n=1 Tax=Chromera velia CCMP2878 TaxID=1169474 RepID=A0A0G4HPV8_9ALVE|eukprot:Cvel_30085.t1-p1 / transcript=Cvel_30085.t1 / gene=Cvel_30085 / organism=Chromera_velia_CCMP2878 / gene_product=hypothetical protein / transcript_product=hypothetical protein / location=Cvel_scaffold4235:7696-8761(+) / protein_length=146 / sequence_SO=supercontig / SO=protein_coding / is_pseudo=false
MKFSSLIASFLVGTAVSLKLKKIKVSHCVLDLGGEENASTPDIYVPVEDGKRFEEQFSQTMAQMVQQGGPVPSMKCTETTVQNIKCDMCNYSEINSEAGHLIQGMVQGADIASCMEGKFESGASKHGGGFEYHPQCFVQKAASISA